jgi:hypothetical protein
LTEKISLILPVPLFPRSLFCISVGKGLGIFSLLQEEIELIYIRIIMEQITRIEYLLEIRRLLSLSLSFLSSEFWVRDSLAGKGPLRWSIFVRICEVSHLIAVVSFRISFVTSLISPILCLYYVLHTNLNNGLVGIRTA